MCKEVNRQYRVEWIQRDGFVGCVLKDTYGEAEGYCNNFEITEGMLELKIVIVSTTETDKIMWKKGI